QMRLPPLDSRRRVIRRAAVNRHPQSRTPRMEDSILDKSLMEQLKTLTGPHLADGCLRSGIPVRFAPPAVKPLSPDMECRGRALPVRHVGSIDVFFEALEGIEPGDVIVIDNGGRLDEAC